MYCKRENIVVVCSYDSIIKTMQRLCPPPPIRTIKIALALRLASLAISRLRARAAHEVARRARELEQSILRRR